MRRLTVIAALAAAALIVGTPGLSQANEFNFGLRAGLTTDPDSFAVGGHAQISGILPDTPALILEPAIEIGFGDEEVAGGSAIDYTTLRGSADLKWMLNAGGDSGLQIYPLAGVSIYNLSLTDCDGDCSHSDIGFNLGGGINFGSLAIEVAAGFGDIPELSARVTFTFGK